MKVSELKQRKRELGYSNEKVSELSGVPLGTVQKVFGGATSTPRYETLKKIEQALFPERNYQQGDYTVDDWFALPDGIRMELIDGKLYDMAPPTYTHQYIAGQLFAEIEIALRAGGRKCLPLMSPVGVQLNKDNKNVLEPDVLIVCDKEKFDRRRGVIFGAPDFVAEVLSPSTAGYDRILKLNKYWTGGVREYWIIDTQNEEIIAYNFESGQPPVRYTFADTVPIGVSGGEIKVDFSAIMERMRDFFAE